MEDDKIIHPGINDSRVLMYLNMHEGEEYHNTELENQLVQLWNKKFLIAESEYKNSRVKDKNVGVWRNAYEGKFFVLDKDGKATNKIQKAVRKLAYEIVEGKVNSHIPAPKMSPRYNADIVPVNTTEKMIMHEMDRMLSEKTNDEAEHHVLIDGATWFKVSWNPFDNTHERSGNPIVECCPVDTVFPQPGVKDYKRLEYIFEKSKITVGECIDIYGREVHASGESDLIDVVTCYYLNKDRYVGKFAWTLDGLTVLCNDLEWGIRKRRECTNCRTIVPINDECPTCGNKKFKYYPVKTERLSEPLAFVKNPYRSGETQDQEQDKNIIDEQNSLPQNTEIPHYLIRQLPFVPYRRVSVPGSIYGMSEVELLLEDQDLINKLLNKVERKSAKSKTYVTKLKDTHINDDSEEVAYIEVESPQECQAIQVKQIIADITEEVNQAQIVYNIARSTVGVTDTDQGKADTTARSGKAKQLQMQASAQRENGPSAMRNLAYAGVYELIFKNLLAFSDEERSFVNVLPDGTEKEECWSKYMFLAKDDDGQLYYRDDFAWSVDTATEITQDRAAMWQMINNDYINGVMGQNIDSTRALMMYWNLMNQNGYPLAKFALAFLKESVQHLPTDVEKVLVSNPEAVQMALSYIQDMQAAAGMANSQKGGARQGAGRLGNGNTHAANVEKTNNKNRVESGAAKTNALAAATGGMQGGTGGVNVNDT